MFQKDKWRKVMSYAWRTSGK